MEQTRDGRARQRLLNTFAIVALLGALLLSALHSVMPGSASPNGVVISEFRFRGPAGGNDEFVELFNTAAGPVDISGWRLEGCSAEAGMASSRATIPSNTILSLGQHFLFTNSSSSGGYSGGVPGNATYGTGIGDTGGARIITATGTVIDGVGSSDGTVDQCREGAGLAIPGTSGDNGFERKNGGAQDTDNNAADFAGPKASNPQNLMNGGGGGTPTPTPVTPTPTPAPATAIRTIQGAVHLSPLAGQAVGNVPGVVTALRANGFYLQDPNPDNEPATSEGIFVFTGAAPAVRVGNVVSVRGTVGEFRPGCNPSSCTARDSAFSNLTITQINSANANVTVTAVGSPTALPAPTIIGAGGRVPPALVIEDDTSGSVETGNTFDPAQDGIDFYESLEGMLVQVNNAVAVGPTNDFGEIPVLADNGANANVRTTRGGIVIRPEDFNPERIIIDDAIVNGEPRVNVGDRFPGAIVGVIDYSFGNFKLLNTAALPAPVSGKLTRETAAAESANGLSIATFNVENLDPADGPAKFDALAAIIVNNLRSPDIIALEEVQDNNGPTNDAVVDANLTYETLIAAIQASGGPAYDYRQVNPVDDQDGGEPGGNIRVGFLFRTDADGLKFVDRATGEDPSTAGTRVVDHPSGPRLSLSPGRITPTDPAWEASRKPLVGEFKYRGETLFVIANHFRSKGGDQPLFGRFQPPARSSEEQRHEQARLVNEFVDSILAADADANIAVLGDLNDFQFSETLDIVKGGALVNLIETLPVPEQYTYVFEGNSQALDHILVSKNLYAALVGYDVVHVNAEFVDQISDHDPQVARFDKPRDQDKGKPGGVK